MSAIVNYRDLLLQAASPRVIPVILEGAAVIIEASAVTVTGPVSGSTTPASIALTAKLTGGLTGSVAWAVISGSASLTPSGNSCTVLGSTMSMGNVTVRATLTSSGKTFSGQINLTRTKDTTALEGEVNSLLNNSKDLVLRASALNFSGNSPSSITLTAERKNGLVGTVSWSVFAGSASLSPSGDSCYISASSVPSGSSVTVRGRVTANGKNYDAYATITKLGLLSGQDQINLTTQVTGTLASGNITGLGALALLNAVNLNTQTVGALNGQTQVTNLGTLAYANAVAANQIGAGTLAAGVVYAGEIDASKITSGELVGRTVKTAASGNYIELSPGALFPTLRVYSNNSSTYYLGVDGIFAQGGVNPLLTGYVNDSSYARVANYSPTQPTMRSVNLLGGPALELSGTLNWNSVNFAAPPNSGLRYLRDNGQWVDPFAITTNTAGSHAGFIVLPDGKRIPYQNP